MFGGGANSAATEPLAVPPFSPRISAAIALRKEYDIGRIVFKGWLSRANVLLIIRRKPITPDIYVTFKGT